MKPGKVNIIIPLFNQEQYIQQCVESSLSQTYTNFDVTVVNDGSTDHSKDIIQEMVDHWNRNERPGFAETIYAGRDYRCHVCGLSLQEKIQRDEAAVAQGLEKENCLNCSNGFWNFDGRFKIVTQENKGLSESRNAGIRSTDGEFILPLDADDWLDPRYLELTVPKMADPKIGIVSTDMQYEGLLHNRIAPQGLSLQHEMSSNDLPVCSLIRRAAFEQTKGYENIFIQLDAKICGYEDWNMWISILKGGWTVAVVNEPLFHYRIKPQSMITQATKQHAGLVRLIHLLHPDLWPNP